MNNNFMSPPQMASPAFNAFTPPTTSTSKITISQSIAERNDFYSNAGSTFIIVTDDRYAALADLDLALRQQNMKQMGEKVNILLSIVKLCSMQKMFSLNLFFSEESTPVNNKNPFQSATTNDIFANKNPFFNGGWSIPTAPVPVNPFMVSSNVQNFITTSHPFCCVKSLIQYTAQNLYYGNRKLLIILHMKLLFTLLVSLNWLIIYISILVLRFGVDWSIMHAIVIHHSEPKVWLLI